MSRVYDRGEVLNYGDAILKQMKINPLPSLDLLNELLAYDATTGDLTWKVKRGNMRAGDIAGSINPKGYRVIGVKHNGKKCNYLAHRIAWALHYGEDPYPYEVDHKHHNRDDNRISELQLATRGENAKNRRVRSVCGYPGLTEKSGGYEVRYRHKYVGWSKDWSEARAMRDQAEADVLRDVTRP